MPAVLFCASEKQRALLRPAMLNRVVRLEPLKFLDVVDRQLVYKMIVMNKPGMEALD